MSDRAIRALTIGEFGRRCGLSVRALRLYDVSGLLPPAEVDPVSGYRRYTPDQLDRARRISLLRQLDMPLAVVAEVLAGTDDQAVVRLDRWWAAQEAAMQSRRGTLGWLRARLNHQADTDTRYEVRRREVPAAKIATIRYDVDQRGLVDAIRTGDWEIRGHLARAGVRVTAEHWVIFHGAVTPDSEAPIEVCVPFTGSAEPAGAMTIRLEPAQAQVYATVTKDDCFYPRIMQAYDAVDAHAAAAGLLPAAPPREVYIAACDEIEGGDPFVLVAQPVEARVRHVSAHE
jgi:DNA-binding transcriptional MerR regulator